MSELGRLLQEARAARELSLADVESATRIRQKYVEALESGDYARLPRGTVARGFLRTYAAYLGLDVSAALSLYGKESGDSGEELPVPEPGKPRLVDYRPLEVELSDGRASGGWWPWVVALLLVLAAGAGSWWFLSRNPGWNPFVAFGPAPATLTPTVTSTRTPWVVTATPAPTETPAPIETPVLPTMTSDLLTLPIPTVPATMTPTPRPTETPEVVSRILLDLIAKQRAWVRVLVDGQVLEEAVLEPGTTRSWEAQESITIRTGNGGGVNLTLNGAELGPMGGVGQVVERGWVVAQGEIAEATPGTPTSTPSPVTTPTATPAG